MGFRYFTARVAQVSGLVGWVRNLPDGRVEVLAFGPSDSMGEFLEDLSKGPPGSVVSNLLVQDEEMKQPLREFVIRHDGGPLWPEE